MEFKSSAGSGELSSAPDGSIVNHIHEYVASRLPEFADKIDKSIQNENGLTDLLCQVLNRTKPAEYFYSFHHQNREDVTTGSSPSTDFAVYSNETSILDVLSESGKTALIKFEAKRLHDLGRAREREYLIGEYDDNGRTNNSGGIERFKNETHAEDISVAGMIGYIQSNNSAYWLKKVNGWIQDEITKPHDSSLKWTNDDKLTAEMSESKLNVYKSKSSRKTKEAIKIKHFWINLVPVLF